MKTKKIFRLLVVFCMLSLSPLGYAQRCNENGRSARVDFILHDDGTVTHKKSGLMWKVCSQGQEWELGLCVGEPSRFNWKQALQEPSIINAGQDRYSNWRVPNIKELISIVEFNCSPAINEEIFPLTDFGYMSSSPSSQVVVRSLDGSEFVSGVFAINFQSGERIVAQRGQLNGRNDDVGYFLLRLVRDNH